jgi:hypothetical protein
MFDVISGQPSDDDVQDVQDVQSKTDPIEGFADVAALGFELKATSTTFALDVTGMCSNLRKGVAVINVIHKTKYGGKFADTWEMSYTVQAEGLDGVKKRKASNAMEIPSMDDLYACYTSITNDMQTVIEAMPDKFKKG